MPLRPKATIVDAVVSEDVERHLSALDGLVDQLQFGREVRYQVQGISNLVRASLLHRVSGLGYHARYVNAEGATDYENGGTLVIS